jgi:hypothetical protein
MNRIARDSRGDDMSEPRHDEALVNRILERVSALSVSAFDGADVNAELAQCMHEAIAQCRGGEGGMGNLTVLTERLQARAQAAEREGQPLVRDTFARAATLAASPA